MRFQFRIRLVAPFGALALVWSSPAAAQSTIQFENTQRAALKWELAYLALSALDTAQTVRCVGRGVCEEGNPLYGQNPTAKRVILTKLVGAGAQFALFTYINERNPKAALRLAQITCIAQGGVVALNARFTFK